MKKALITGVTGHDGAHLSEFCRAGLAALVRSVVGSRAEIRWDADKPDATLLDVSRLQALGWRPRSGCARAFTVPMAHAGDGSRRLFIVEQRGVVKVSKRGQVLPIPFLDLQCPIYVYTHDCASHEKVASTG